MMALVVVGCGRTGQRVSEGPEGYVCGPGTHVAGDACVADHDRDASAHAASDMSRRGADLAGGDAGPAHGADAGSDDGDAGPTSDDAGAMDGGSDVPADLGPPPSSSGSAVTYQTDPAHSGGQPDSALRPPLARRWSVTLDSRYLSYPLIVGDQVFVTGSGSGAPRLYALSATTGEHTWGPLTVATAAYRAAYAALDNGALFVIDGTGTVQSFDIASGATGWRRSLGAGGQVGPPVAVGGVVYAVLDGTLFALDARDGSTRWQGGRGSFLTSPAWTPGAVILEYVLGEVSAFRPMDGGFLWGDFCHCTGGGGGDIPVIYDGRVYAPDSTGLRQAAYRLSDGASLGAYGASALPAFENGFGFFRTFSTVEGRDSHGNVWWSFAGDGALDSTPLAAGGFVYLGSTLGHLYALDEASGRLVWSDTLSAAIAPSNYNDGADHITGLAASADLLVVPAGSTLTAYGN
jgi:outer membrane protein assembly factor BamB